LVSTGLSGVFLLAAQLSSEPAVMATLLLLTLSFACFFGRFGPFWSLPSEVLPTPVAGVGIAVINGFGNLGGFVGPLVFGAIRSSTGSFNLALSLAGLLLILSAASLLLLHVPMAKAAVIPASTGRRSPHIAAPGANSVH